MVELKKLEQAVLRGKIGHGFDTSKWKDNVYKNTALTLKLKRRVFR